MEYQKLGRTDLDVSRICLGTMTWGRQNSQDEGFAQMDYAMKQGINFWDTAELYAVPPLPETYGKTEEIIGNWFAANGCREKVVLASKIVGKGRPYIRGGAPFTGKDIGPAVEASLNRLQTDYLDLYQLHWPNRGGYAFRNNWVFDPTQQPNRTEIENDILDVLTALDAEVKAGRIKHIGLSNETAWGTMMFLQMAEKHGLPRVASIQNEYSLLHRPFDWDLSEVSHHEDVTLMAYSVLGMGLLSGKYQYGRLPEEARGAINGLDRRMTPQALAAVERYLHVAKRHGLDPCQMAIAFTLQRPYQPIVIVGATTLEQLKVDIEAVDITLDEAVLEDIQAVRRDYPLAF